MKISQDMERKFTLVLVLSRAVKPTLKFMHSETQIPESTIKRQLAALREEFGMDIQFVREPSGSRGASGYYILNDWGIINKAAFLARYSRMKS